MSNLEKILLVAAVVEFFVIIFSVFIQKFLLNQLQKGDDELKILESENFVLKVNKNDSEKERNTLLSTLEDIRDLLDKND